jgi:serine protease inhibitor
MKLSQLEVKKSVATDLMHWLPYVPHKDGSVSGLNALEETMRRSAEDSERQRQYATNDPLVLTVANRLFGQSGYEFRQSFLSLLKDSYAAPFEALDFKKEPAPAARHINAWVESQTRERIRNLISETALDELTRLVLVNAIYLKAPWFKPFQTSATKPGPFYVNGLSLFLGHVTDPGDELRNQRTRRSAIRVSPPSATTAFR